jgi:chaperonin GroEL (HSP60 family)
LPGAGVIEMICARELEKCAVVNDMSSEIYRIFSECMKGLLEISLGNAGYSPVEVYDILSKSNIPLSVLRTSSSEVYDDYPSKLSALKRSVEVVHLLFNTGNIVTNVNK